MGVDEYFRSVGIGDSTVWDRDRRKRIFYVAQEDSLFWRDTISSTRSSTTPSFGFFMTPPTLASGRAVEIVIVAAIPKITGLWVKIKTGIWDANLGSFMALLCWCGGGITITFAATFNDTCQCEGITLLSCGTMRILSAGTLSSACQCGGTTLLSCIGTNSSFSSYCAGCPCGP